MKYEYAQVSAEAMTNTRYPDLGLVHKMNKLAEEGWHLVHFMENVNLPYPGGNGYPMKGVAALMERIVD